MTAVGTKAADVQTHNGGSQSVNITMPLPPHDSTDVQGEQCPEVVAAQADGLTWYSMTVKERIVLLQVRHAYPDEIIITKESPDLWDAALSLKRYGLVKMTTSWLDCHTTASIYATDTGRAMLKEPCWADRCSLLPFTVAQRRAERDGWKGEVRIGDATVIAWAKSAGGGMAIRHRMFTGMNRRGQVFFQGMSQESRITHAAGLLRSMTLLGVTA